MTRRLSSSFILRPSDFSRLLDGQKRQQRPLLRPDGLHSQRVNEVRRAKYEVRTKQDDFVLRSSNFILLMAHR